MKMMILTVAFLTSMQLFASCVEDKTLQTQVIKLQELLGFTCVVTTPVADDALPDFTPRTPGTDLGGPFQVTHTCSKVLTNGDQQTRTVVSSGIVTHLYLTVGPCEVVDTVKITKDEF